MDEEEVVLGLAPKNRWKRKSTAADLVVHWVEPNPAESDSPRRGELHIEDSMLSAVRNLCLRRRPGQDLLLHPTGPPGNTRNAARALAQRQAAGPTSSIPPV